MCDFFLCELCDLRIAFLISGGGGPMPRLRKGTAVPITRARKEEQVARYAELLKASTGFAIVSPKNLAVNKIEALRRQVRDAGGEYVVGKNTLVIKALEQAGWVVPQDQLTGMTAVIFGKDAFPDVAKALLAFIEKEKLDEDKL